MTDYGLTTTGFVGKSHEVCKSEISADIKALRGKSTNTEGTSLIGNFVAIFAERESLLWDLGQALAAAKDPDAATGTSQDAVSAISGTLRDPASKSAVDVTLTGTPATVVLSGFIVRTASTDAGFETLEDCTILAVNAWVPSTAYVVGDRRRNASRVYVCITAGTSAGSGGPTTTSADITDGTVHWRYVGEGTGAVDVSAAALETGPIIAASGDLTVIGTPQVGVSTSMNLLDADLGSDLQSDEALRIDREEEIAKLGAGTPDALRAELLALEGVDACTVFENVTDVTDANGLPPHSFECLVQGGDSTEIATLIQQHRHAGIVTHGAVSVTLQDSQGYDQVIKFSRPTEIDIYVAITIEVDQADYPADIADLVKAAIVAWGDTQESGVNVRASRVGAAGLVDEDGDDLPGVLGYTVCNIDDAPAPASSASIAISLRQRAVFDTSRIAVTVTEVEP